MDAVHARFYKGAGYTLLSAAGLSLVGLCAKYGVARFSVVSLIFFRYFFSAIFLFIGVCFTEPWRDIFRWRHAKMQIMRAFFVLLSQYCFFFYLGKNSLLNAAALLNTGPVFIAVIDWAILRNKVGLSTWISSGISFLGALLILQPDAGIFSLMSLIGLLSGISQGASQVVFGMQSKKEEGPQLGIFHLFLLCSAFSFIPFCFFPSGTAASSHSLGWDIWLLTALSLSSIFNQIFRAISYRYDKPSKLSPYLYFAVLLAGFWDWVFFRRVPDALALTGSFLIVLGGLLKIYLRAKILARIEKKPPPPGDHTKNNK